MKGIAIREKHNPRLTHAFIRNKTDIKEQIRALKNDKGMLTVDRSYIADILRSQY